MTATFQVVINEILRDFINKKKVAAFVDDMLVGTETEEGHNEIVDEVLRRLEENDVCETREVYMESAEDWILRDCHRTQ